MKLNKLPVVALIASLLTAGSAGAEDIDLFLNPPEGSITDPNVLFVLDNSANWKNNSGSYRKKDVIHQALPQVFLDPEITDTMNVGIMTYTKNSTGGSIFANVESLTSTYQAELAGRILQPPRWSGGMTVGENDYIISSGDTDHPFNGHIYAVTSAGDTQTTGSSEPTWPTDGSSVTDANGVTYSDLGELVTLSGNDIDNNVADIKSSSKSPYALSLYEAYLYYSGEAPLHGTEDNLYDINGDGTDTDGDGNDWDKDGFGYDSDAVSGGQYVSPSADSCAKNFVILIGNGGPDSGENNEAESELTALGGKLDSDPVDISPDNYESNWADEYARFMTATDVSSKDDKQGIITYVIDVVHPDDAEKNKPAKAERSFLKSIAKQGGGRYFQAKDVAEVKAAIEEILEEIQAVNSVFASTTLPVSVNVRGTNLNQVYMGVFRPDANALPRWVGNLKLYRLAVDTDTESLYLADKNGDPAESPTTGFIVSDAVSYWTKDSDFWAFHAEYADSDSPDGEIVEKGAAAQNLRAMDLAQDRNLYTHVAECSNVLSNCTFDTDTSGLDADLVDWIWGYDLDNENDDDATDDVRASIHGDVLHSRPAVINYNRNSPSDEEDIIAFYGANDGVFHAVEGGKDGDLDDGDELWGFIPEEFFGELKTLYDNSPAITADGGAKPYFADGNIGVYQHDANADGVINNDDKVHLFISMRRGGRMIYALDVSNPSDPKLLWKKTNNDTGWGELGQTWSEPKVSTVDIDGTATTVLIMGAGYDATAEDAASQGTATMGRGIFVVNADDGSILWQAGPSGSDTASFEPVTDMTFPIPSDVTVIDRDRDGSDDRLYVGDTGGQVWRVDISDSNTSNWSVTKLASIADDSDSGGRKFLYAPDVVYADGYDAILIGSGDREHPADTTVINRFYMFKDTLPDDSWTPITETVEDDGSTDLYDATDNLIQDGDTDQQDAAQSALANARGWYITLEDDGEKVVTSAVTLSGSTFFNTNAPTSNNDSSCVAGLGTARNYIVSYEDATATNDMDGVAGLTKSDRSNSVVGGGFPPSPVPVIVEIDGKKYQAVVSGTKVLTPPNVQLERRERVYWYRPGID